MIKKLHTLNLTLGALTATLVLGGCQDEDFGVTAEDMRQANFKKHFEQQYGTIDPDMNWDLSAMPRTAKYEVNHQNTTRAYATGGDGLTFSYPGGEHPHDGTSYSGGDDDSNYSNWYTVEANTLSWLNAQLVESRNNTNLGHPFSLRFPDNKIAIIPIYEGKAGMIWELHLVYGGKDYAIWERSQGIRCHREDDTNGAWFYPDQTYDNGQTSDAENDYVQAQPIIIEGGTKDAEFQLYLKVTQGSDGWAETGACQYANEGMMLALDCPLPSNLDAFTDQQNSLAMVIGCEDADGHNSDWDMNDVVFLIAGYPSIPDIVEFTKKRYLCEDLGDTYDFDFNDIVIDVEEEVRKEAYIDNGEIKRREVAGSKVQRATIKHLCGTIPIQATVGDYAFPAIADPTNHRQTYQNLGEEREVVSQGVGWNPNITKTITGWDAATNNVIITAYAPTNASAGIDFTDFSDRAAKDFSALERTFPHHGRVPYIIAVDQSVGWMEEHASIPKSWFKNWEEGASDKYDEWNPKTNKNLWQSADGENLGGWGQAVAIIHTADLPAGIEAGDKIRFTFADNTKFRACYDSNGWQDYFGDTEVSANATYTWTLSDDDVSKLEEFGFFVRGEYGKITSIDFVPDQKFTLSLKVAAGCEGMGSVSVSPSGTLFSNGSTLTLTATPAEGYKFTSWNDGSTDRVHQITIESNLTLEAFFAEAQKHNVRITPGANGKISVNGTEYTTTFEASNVYEGTEYVVVAIPDDGYELDSWSDGGAASHTLTVGNEDLNVTASFKVKQFHLTLGSATGGHYRYKTNVSDYIDYDPAKGIDYVATQTITVMAIADEGYEFARWTDGNTQAERVFTQTSGEYTAKFKAEGAADGPTVLFEGEQSTDNCQQVIAPDDTEAFYAGATVKIYFTGGWLNVHYGQWNQKTGWDGNPRTKVLTADDVSDIQSRGLWAHGDGNVTKVTIE